MNDISKGYEGAQRASDHADRVSKEPLFSKIAWVRFLEYILAVKSDPNCPNTITTERFREWAKAHSLPEPPDARAYGNVTRKASAKGLIRDSLERSREGSHGREVVVWEIV